MASTQIQHARYINLHAADVVANYLQRRLAGDPVDVALVSTADQWRIDAVAFAVYLRSRVPADVDALRAHAPFLWMRSDDCDLV